MSYKFNYFLLLILLVPFLGISQEVEIGKIDKEFFEPLQDAIYKDEAAVILHKYQEVTFYIEDWEQGWDTYQKVHKVIKINSKEGLDQANVSLLLYHKSDARKRRLESVKATTYTLKDGKVQKQRMRKDAIFEKEVSEESTEFSFVLPSVQVGDIIEYTYTVVTPASDYINDIVYQEDIPIKNFNATLEIPEMFIYRRYTKGSLKPDIKDELRLTSARLSYDQKTSFGTKTHKDKTTTMRYNELVTTINAQDIPALKEEPYINNINNYRSSLVYELAATEFNKGVEEDLAVTWDGVTKYLLGNSILGKPLSRTGFLKEDIVRFRESATNLNQRAKAIYNYVRDSYNWDGKGISYTNSTLRNVYKSKKGNAAEINLILIDLMRGAGIQAQPVMISTKKNGVPIYPTLDGFDYLVAAVQIDKERVLLDATEKNASWGQLPERVLNWEGRMIKDGQPAEVVKLYPSRHAQSQIVATGTVSTDGSLRGSYKQRLSGNLALGFRNDFENASLDEVQESFLRGLSLEEISDFSLQKDEIEKPVQIEATFYRDSAFDIIEDAFYIEPLSVLTKDENPFKSNNRYFPIDFNYPFRTSAQVSLSIPEGYVVSQVPENSKLELPEGMGNYVFRCTVSGNAVQVSSTLTINAVIVPSSFYWTIKEFYSKMFLKLQEKIVLKIAS